MSAVPLEILNIKLKLVVVSRIRSQLASRIYLLDIDFVVRVAGDSPAVLSSHKVTQGSGSVYTEVIHENPVALQI